MSDGFTNTDQSKGFVQGARMKYVTVKGSVRQLPKGKSGRKYFKRLANRMVRQESKRITRGME